MLTSWLAYAEERMPDVTLVLSGVSGAKDAQRLERAVSRLGAVRLVNVDAEKGLLLVKGSVPGANGSYVVIKVSDQGTNKK